MYFDPGPARQAPTEGRGPYWGGTTGGMRCMSLACERRSYCSPGPATGKYPPDCIMSATEDLPGYLNPQQPIDRNPYAPDVTGGATGPPLYARRSDDQSATGSSGFDFGSFMQGTTFGLPTWLLVAGAAGFFFFRKGR